MYPPVTQSPRDYKGKIRKYDVEKKAFVESEETISILFDIKDINRDPKKFKNPNDFDPDNFLNDDGTFNKELADELLTFYFGPQGCPGQRFSEEELTVLTAELLARYEIVHEPGPIEPEVLSQATEKPKNNKHKLRVRNALEKISLEG